MNKIVLIDYGAGNVRSASRALWRAAELVETDALISVSSEPEIILSADRVVLPGVGHFADCKKELENRPGALDALTEVVQNKGRPFYGICVGMQLLAQRGLEDGDTAGLNWVPGEVDKLVPADSTLPVPHMGWNEIDVNDHPIFEGIGASPHVYFTHSYVMNCKNDSNVAATFDYGGVFTAAIAKDNLFGSQFHPEKSQALGQKLLANFLTWSP